MSSDVTVTFSKPHNYGGHSFEAGDKLTLPKGQAKLLKSAGVLKQEKKSDG